MNGWATVLSALSDRLGSVARWCSRQKDDLLRDLLVGLVLGAATLALAFWFDGRIADHQETLAEDLARQGEVFENVRFVRQVSVDDAPWKHFIGLDLQSAVLTGLRLRCESPSSAACADFSLANLAGADLRRSRLPFAVLNKAILEDADLRELGLYRRGFARPT